MTNSLRQVSKKFFREGGAREDQRDAFEMIRWLREERHFGNFPHSRQWSAGIDSIRPMAIGIHSGVYHCRFTVVVKNGTYNVYQLADEILEFGYFYGGGRMSPRKNPLLTGRTIRNLMGELLLTVRNGEDLIHGLHRIAKDVRTRITDEPLEAIIRDILKAGNDLGLSVFDEGWAPIRSSKPTHTGQGFQYAGAYRVLRAGSAVVQVRREEENDDLVQVQVEGHMKADLSELKYQSLLWSYIAWQKLKPVADRIWPRTIDPNIRVMLDLLQEKGF